LHKPWDVQLALYIRHHDCVYPLYCRKKEKGMLVRQRVQKIM